MNPKKNKYNIMLSLAHKKINSAVGQLNLQKLWAVTTKIVFQSLIILFKSHKKNYDVITNFFLQK